MLNKDFREFIELLNKNDVQYLVVGGYAVAFYGYPRYTKDLDVWIWVNDKNAKHLIIALNEFGFGSSGLSTDDFLQKGFVVQLGYPPNRIDIITEIDGLDFKDCINTKNVLQLDGIDVPFIDLKNLIKNKRSSGRAQDLADAEALENGDV